METGGIQGANNGEEKRVQLGIKYKQRYAVRGIPLFVKVKECYF